MRLLCLSLFALALTGADQPIPYSHKTHLKMGLKCNECHTMPGKGELATYPAESKCMTCHTAVKKESPHIQLLAEYARKKAPVPWVQVYKLPEFVGSRLRPLPRPGCRTRSDHEGKAHHDGCLHGLPRRTQGLQRVQPMPQPRLDGSLLTSPKS